MIRQSANLCDVMVVDDDPVCLVMAKRLLQRQGCVVRTNTCPHAALREIVRQPPNVLLTDWVMPKINGGELCRAVRELDLSRYVYTIVLTSCARDFVVRALDSGADDFATKPIDPDELTARIRAGKRILDLESRLVTLSERDSLTGLLNRPTFYSQFQEHFDESQERGMPLSCVMLDLDHFKSINDRYGHLAGDEVLRSVGSELSKCLPKEAVVGRYGGEEFAISLPSFDEDQAEVATRAIHAGLAERSFHFGAQDFLRVTASVGVAELGNEHRTPTELLNAADQNLLMAKRIGRNRTVTGNFR